MQSALFQDLKFAQTLRVSNYQSCTLLDLWMALSRVCVLMDLRPPGAAVVRKYTGLWRYPTAPNWAGSTERRRNHPDMHALVFILESFHWYDN